MLAEIKVVKEILNTGGIVIFPTETVYGVGCLLESRKAIGKLYQIKNRPLTQPTLGLFGSIQKVEEFVILSEEAQRLASEFWPGPLTMVVKAKKSLPQQVLGASDSLAVRIPANIWLRSLLIELDRPIAGPSANLKGQKPPKKFTEIDKSLIKLVDYVVASEPGGQQPSTIVDLTDKKRVKMIREGPISKSSVLKVLERKI